MTRGTDKQTWTVENVRPVLEQWDERVRREVSRFARLVPEAEARGSVLREPASEEEVAEAEERLGLRFPPSYRSFLLISNGAYASSIGAEKWHREEERPHGFLAVRDVAPMAEVDAGKIELWTKDPVLNNPAKDEAPVGIKGVDVSYFKPMQHALLISRPHENDRDALVPRPGEQEWEFWSFHHSGAVAYRSFADWLFAVLKRPDLRPKPAQAEEYVAGVREGNLHMILSLAEIDDPRAGDIACEVLDDEQAPRLPGQEIGPGERERRRAIAAHALGLLKERQFVPTLRRAYLSATRKEMRFEALKGLVECEASDAKELLADAAQNEPDRPVRRWAVQRLGELD